MTFLCILFAELLRIMQVHAAVSTVFGSIIAGGDCSFLSKYAGSAPLARYQPGESSQSISVLCAESVPCTGRGKDGTCSCQGGRQAGCAGFSPQSNSEEQVPSLLTQHCRLPVMHAAVKQAFIPWLLIT